MFGNLARTIAEQLAAPAEPTTCCAGHNAAPLACSWAKVRTTKRLKRQSAQGAQPNTISSEDMEEQYKLFGDLAASLMKSSPPAAEPAAPAVDSAGGKSLHQRALSPQDQDRMEEDSSPSPAEFPAMPPRVDTGLPENWRSRVEEIQHSGSWDRLSGAFVVSVDQGTDTVLFCPEREVMADFSDAGVSGSTYVHDWERAVARGYLLGFRRVGDVVHPWCFCCGDWATQESLLQHRDAGPVAPCDAELCRHLSSVMAQGRQLIQSQIGECDVSDAQVHELLLGVQSGWQLLDLSGVKEVLAVSGEHWGEHSEAARFWSQPFAGGDLFWSYSPRVGESYRKCTGVVLRTTKAVRSLTCKGGSNLCGHASVVRAALKLPRHSGKFCTDEYFSNHLHKVLDAGQENMRLRCRSLLGRAPDHGPRGVAASLHDDAEEPVTLSEAAKCLRGRSPSFPALFLCLFSGSIFWGITLEASLGCPTRPPHPPTPHPRHSRRLSV